MSHPAKAVTFYRKAGSDGKLSKLVIDGKKYQLLNLQELVIYNVQNTDDGLYVCQVENDLLQDKEIKIFINQCKFRIFIYFIIIIIVIIVIIIIIIVIIEVLQSSPGTAELLINNVSGICIWSLEYYFLDV